MKRAIQLGANALGSAAPNPMVGAVLTYEDRILGEGYTSKYGGPHAEVNAIAAVKEKDLLHKATLYVTLEPCSHFGKTPPCTDLIVKHAIPQVVIGTRDPHQRVNGKGILQLKEAGCKVELGILEADCREHHRRFLCVHEKKRPYVILKWAQSPDGFMAPEDSERTPNGRPYWITNKRSRQLVHKWRTEEPAILVGNTTVIRDNPKLNARFWKGKSPLRLVLDPNLRASGNFDVFDNSAETIVITSTKDAERRQRERTYELLENGRPVAAQICGLLLSMEIQSLIVEGGAQTLQTFINENIWDEARIFSGGTFLGKGLKAPLLRGREAGSTAIGDNQLTILRND